LKEPQKKDPNDILHYALGNQHPNTHIPKKGKEKSMEKNAKTIILSMLGCCFYFYSFPLLLLLLYNKVTTLNSVFSITST
jgi:hypothetical protein